MALLKLVVACPAGGEWGALLGAGAGLVGSPLLPQDARLAALRPLRPFAAGELCAYAGTPTNNTALAKLTASSGLHIPHVTPLDCLLALPQPFMLFLIFYEIMKSAFVLQQSQRSTVARR